MAPYTALIANAVVTTVLAVCIACVEAGNITWVGGHVRGTRISLPNIELIAANTAVVDICLPLGVKEVKVISCRRGVAYVPGR